MTDEQKKQMDGRNGKEQEREPKICKMSQMRK